MLLHDVHDGRRPGDLLAVAREPDLVVPTVKLYTKGVADHPQMAIRCPEQSNFLLWLFYRNTEDSLHPSAAGGEFNPLFHPIGPMSSVSANPLFRHLQSSGK